MNCKIILTGILKCEDEYLIVRRSDNDNFMPGAWEFPGGNLEYGEIIKDGLSRELYEEIGYSLNENVAKLINYSDEIKKDIHVIELDFLIICVNKELSIKLSIEHTEYRWVKKGSELLDEFIKSKIEGVK